MSFFSAAASQPDAPVAAKPPAPQVATKSPAPPVAAKPPAPPVATKPPAPSVASQAVTLPKPTQEKFRFTTYFPGTAPAPVDTPPFRFTVEEKNPGTNTFFSPVRDDPK